MYAVVDIELTEDKEIIDIAIISADKQFNIISKEDYLLKPSQPISKFMTNLTGISQEMLDDKKSFAEMSSKLHKSLEGKILICHGVQQDYRMLRDEFSKVGIEYEPTCLLDTVELTKIFFPKLKSYRLADIIESLNIRIDGNVHRANVDTYATYKLVKLIIEKLNKVSDKNYNYLCSLLREYSEDYANFLGNYRIVNKESEDYISLYGLDFARFKAVKKENKKKHSVYISSIDELAYIDIHFKNEKDRFVVLKDKFSYLCLNFFDIVKDEIKTKNLLLLLMRILVWIQETEYGNLDELNLDPSEKIWIHTVYDENKEVLDDYYYQENLNYAQGYENIVTNYKSALFFMSDDCLKNAHYIAENKEILATEIRRLSSKIYYYKNIITELNISINQKNNKEMQYVKECIENILAYIYEMYLDESLALYEEAIEYIVQDIEYIKNLITKNNKAKLLKVQKFLNILHSILNDKNKGYYSFENLGMSNSLFIKYNDVKKEKLLVNSLYKKSIDYLDKKSKLAIKDSRKVDLSSLDYEKQYLYIFNTNKYRELHYMKRDKKSICRFKNYSDLSSFADLYKDLEKTDKNCFVCYANKEILAYSLYLKNVFSEIISFKNIEV